AGRVASIPLCAECDDRAPLVAGARASIPVPVECEAPGRRRERSGSDCRAAQGRRLLSYPCADQFHTRTCFFLRKGDAFTQLGVTGEPGEFLARPRAATKGNVALWGRHRPAYPHERTGMLSRSRHPDARRG